MPRLTIDGKEVEVPEGTNLIEAARVAGVEVPHYCYHPALSVAGQCRLCMVDVEKAPRPTIACNTPAADGMVVRTDTERVRETRRSIMEFHLINHPLDCPVCDQAGECWLQIYYMRHGLYEPRMVDDKVRKPKAVPLGPHVILDAERCILCSRCVRFCDEITGTGELGIFHRGDHSEIGLFPGRVLDNPYSGNVVDICPVGALTDRDFRFQVRVWYLDTARSVCPGCARGCNIEVHVNRRRPHHAGGRRVARLKPRFNADVNKWWMCDEGRYGFGFVDDPDRLTVPARRQGDEPVPVAWEEALGALTAALRRPAERVAVIASPKMPNEDLFALRRLVEVLGVRQVGFRVPPAAPGYEDDLLIRADKNPNTRGAELIGLDGDVAAILAAARAGQVDTLWVFDHDLLASGWPETDVARALTAAETLVFTGTNANRTSARAHLVLPAAAWVERDGTFTNFEGRVQRFRSAVDPLGEARPTWRIIGDALAALGAPAGASRAEHWFRALAAAVPAFAGLTYQALGDTGLLVRAPAEAVS
ncbi:MAG TPA: molybdopterin-dependent oxidoreductase [Candidatus Binatia bacterium]|nr:molybdopterin-dependent oxidoreductase [Candidatus Binatia bacterium]